MISLLLLRTHPLSFQQALQNNWLPQFSHIYLQTHKLYSYSIYVLVIKKFNFLPLFSSTVWLFPADYASLVGASLALQLSGCWRVCCLFWNAHSMSLPPSWKQLCSKSFKKLLRVSPMNYMPLISCLPYLLQWHFKFITQI